MIDDTPSSANAKIDIDIRHLFAFGIEKSLEQQIVLDRIDISDPQTIRRERSGGRAPARTDRNALLAGIFDKIPDDQKVTRKAHRIDRCDLSIEPCGIIVQRILERAERESRLPFLSTTLLKAVTQNLFKITFDRRMARIDRYRIIWQLSLLVALRQIERAHFGDFKRISERFGQFVAKNVPHLVRRTEIIDRVFCRVSRCLA